MIPDLQLLKHVVRMICCVLRHTLIFLFSNMIEIKEKLVANLVELKVLVNSTLSNSEVPSDHVSSPSASLVVENKDASKASMPVQVLYHCFTQAEARENKVAYIVEGLLKHHWVSGDPKEEWAGAYQVVVPKIYCLQVLTLAHEHPWSEHMRVTKSPSAFLRAWTQI